MFFKEILRDHKNAYFFSVNDKILIHGNRNVLASPLLQGSAKEIPRERGRLARIYLKPINLKLNGILKYLLADTLNSRISLLMF